MFVYIEVYQHLFSKPKIIFLILITDNNWSKLETIFLLFFSHLYDALLYNNHQIESIRKPCEFVSLYALNLVFHETYDVLFNNDWNVTHSKSFYSNNILCWLINKTESCVDAPHWELVIRWVDGDRRDITKKRTLISRKNFFLFKYYCHRWSRVSKYVPVPFGC